tara:strand:- start:276 stop:434 length:159 start_codon:yes stop_codon:yes gene_type:complete
LTKTREFPHFVRQALYQKVGEIPIDRGSNPRGLVCFFKGDINGIGIIADNQK